MGLGKSDMSKKWQICSIDKQHHIGVTGVGAAGCCMTKLGLGKLGMGRKWHTCRAMP